jgi:hypothetical protein
VKQYNLNQVGEPQPFLRILLSNSTSVVFGTTQHALLWRAPLSKAQSPSRRLRPFRRPSLRAAKPILNSFCRICFLEQETTSTIDPRSAFAAPQNVLEQPSLIDGSESPSTDEAQGEAADVSTVSSQSGPGRTVSDASKLAVTVEGPFLLSSIIPSGVGVVNSRISFHKDGRPESISSEASTDASSSSSGTTTDSFCSSPTLPDNTQSTQQDSPPMSGPDHLHIAPTSRSAIDTQSRSSSLTCSQCPRSFTTRQKLE